MTEASVARQHLDAGRLSEAINAVTADVRARPTDVEKRGLLAELLCFAGELDRADKQLDLIGDQSPQAALGVALFRQCLRAEQARREVFGNGRVPEFLSPPPQHVTLHLQAMVELREGREQEAALLLQEAEARRPRPTGTMDGKAFDDFRDGDDLVAPVFEVCTSTGKYYWIPVETVISVHFHKAERLRDLIWRRATMSVADGPDGDVYIPSVYVPIGDKDERALLGRVTDWSGGNGHPVRGIGQRCWLVGDEGVAIQDAGAFEFDHPGR